MGILNSNDLLSSKGHTEGGILHDQDAPPIIGFCLWCERDFYSMEEADSHHADESKVCHGFQKWNDTVMS